MRYHYDKNAICVKVHFDRFNHPLYDHCTVYKRGDKGLAVVQTHYNKKTKIAWWGPIDLNIMYEILAHADFKEYFETHASEPDESGVYPTVPVRKAMWALKMKPLPKSLWEKGFDS